MTRLSTRESSMTTRSTQTRPVIQGWVWHPGGTCRYLTNWSDVDAAWRAHDSRLWLDLQRPSQEDIHKLDSIIDLDDRALHDCLDGPSRPRIDEYEEYLALFLYGVLSSHQQERLLPHSVAAFCGERFLVTVHPEPMPSIRLLFERCEKHGAAMFEQGVDVLLYRLVDTLVDNFLELLDQFDERLDSLETQSFDANAEVVILRASARLRNELMEIRRLASAQRALLAPVARGEFDYVSANLGTEFRHVEEHLTHTLDRIEGMRERLSGALHNYHSTLTKRTNDIVRVLTVVAAVILPLSLVAGIYGMNLPVWPPGNLPGSFWTVLTVMACIGGGLLWFFRTRRWF